jgi:hypothetical protein
MFEMIELEGQIILVAVFSLSVTEQVDDDDEAISNAFNLMNKTKLNTIML